MKDDLHQLLEAERRLAVRLDEARTAATRLLEAARSDAKELTARAEEDERAGRARLATEVHTELETELARITARAEARVQRYTAITADRLREFSVFVLQSLLEAVPAGRP